MNSKNCTIILLLLFTFSIGGLCRKIIYPWRATTAIVKAGESFEVWFDADDGQIINSIELQGPYNIVNSSYSVEKGNWVYDHWSGYTFNRKVKVEIPFNAPSDRYDLILKTSTGDVISLAAVKIIREFKGIYYIMHFSDFHRWERSETPEIAYKEQSVVVDIANIINPEIFIETGDCYWQNTSSMSITETRLAEYMNGTESINGLNDLNAPYFAIPGNHDTPHHNWYKEPDVATSARAWNKLFGLSCHNFTYGNTRFIGVTNSWCPTTGGGDPDYVANYQWQLDEAKVWIDSVGKGSLRIGFFHVPQESVPPLYNSFKSAQAPFGLMLGGHIHKWERNPMSIDGKKIIYIADGVQNGKNGVPFNLYKIDGENGTFEPVGNSYAAHLGIETEKDYNSSKLKLRYANENNGRYSDNTATIVNKFDFPIDGARVRFVMQKGIIYDVSNLNVHQQFNGEKYHIVDAEVDLKANSITEISILPDDVCPEDPNKTKPGNCGCGVEEGNCSTFPLNVKNGTGSGDYYPFENVPIVADPSPPGQKFDMWNIISGVPVIFNDQASSTTLYLSEHDAIVTASYVEVSPVYQAEDAQFEGVSFDNKHLGYNGSGYLEYNNASQDYIEWIVNIPSSSSYCLKIRYKYSEPTSSRSLALKVNDILKVDSLDFPVPFIWSNWAEITSEQELNTGLNRIRLTSIEKNRLYIDEIRVSEASSELTGIEGAWDVIHKESVLRQNSPNPFNSHTVIAYTIPEETPVSIKVYDSMGRMIACLVDEIKQTGHYKIAFNGREFCNGTYFYRMHTGDFLETKSLILLK